MGVQIVYTSRTGNTEKLAEAVFAAVPVKEKNVKRIEERTERDDGEMYLVGFWTDRSRDSKFGDLGSAWKPPREKGCTVWNLRHGECARIL